eukprot:4709821-Amphidinium_carterae.1
MSIDADEEADQHTMGEEVIYETEADRIMSDSRAATRNAMEVDEGSLGSTFASETRNPNRDRQLSEQEREGAPGRLSQVPPLKRDL